MSFDDPIPPYMRSALEEAERFQRMLDQSGVWRLLEQVAATQHVLENQGLGAALLKDAVYGGAVDGLDKLINPYESKILGETFALRDAVESVGASFKYAVPDWLDAARSRTEMLVPGLGSDLALARSRFDELGAGILGQFAASNTALLGIDTGTLAALGVESMSGQAATILALNSAMGAFAERNAEVARAMSGYHIAGQLAAARFEEAFASADRWASLETVRNLRSFSSAYDRAVADLMMAGGAYDALLPHVPPELFAHTSLLDLLRPEPELEETEEARGVFVDETRRQFRAVLASRYPELLEHVTAADRAREDRAAGWPATFCLALRRLVEHAFEIIAPVPHVRSWSLFSSVATGDEKKLRAQFVQKSGMPTRYARVLYAMKVDDPRTTIALPSFVKADFNSVNASLELLNTHIHEFQVPAEEAALDLAQARVERYTLFLLLLAGGES